MAEKDEFAFDFSERCYPGVSPKRVSEDHVQAYIFVKRFAADKIILDIACGEGYGSNMLKNAGARKVFSIDNNPDIVKHASRTYPGVSFSVADATSTNFPDESFDMVVCLAAWHHLDGYAEFPKEVSRILKPSGLLIFSVPNEKIIYRNPFHKHFLTKFYRVDFTKEKAEKLLDPFFVIEGWYGQRFVKKYYANRLVRLFLHLGSFMSSYIASRVHSAFVLADGPIVRPLLSDNARYMLAICRNKNKTIS